MSDNQLIREKTTNALLNNDNKALEEYKFKKTLLKDINNLRIMLEEVVEKNTVLANEVVNLKTRVDELENLKGKNNV